MHSCVKWKVSYTLLFPSSSLEMEIVPELYVQSSPQENANTLALQGKDGRPAIVVVTLALLDRCTDEEVQAIIGHELGH